MTSCTEDGRTTQYRYNFAAAEEDHLPGRFQGHAPAGAGRSDRGPVQGRRLPPCPNLPAPTSVCSLAISNPHQAYCLPPTVQYCVCRAHRLASCRRRVGQQRRHRPEALPLDDRRRISQALISPGEGGKAGGARSGVRTAQNAAQRAGAGDSGESQSSKEESTSAIAYATSDDFV